MKISLLFILQFVLLLNGYGQAHSADFKTITVTKKVKEFSDKFDLTSPLNSFVTLTYIYINGKDRLLRSLNTIKNKSLFPDSTAVNTLVSDDVRNRYLDTKIDEIITYKDSVAFVISETADTGQQFYYSIRSFYFEASSWVSSGESTAMNIKDARRFVSDRSELFFGEFKSIQLRFYRNN